MSTKTKEEKVFFWGLFVVSRQSYGSFIFKYCVSGCR